MQYRDDKKNSNSLSALGLGCMRLPLRLGGVDLDATEKILLRSLELGVNYFDTAYSYPGNEDALGRVIERNGVRDRMLIATKLPHSRCRTIDDAEHLFSTSLSRLRTDRADYYLIHNLVTFDQWERLMGLGVIPWLERKCEEGAIGTVGFSFHGGFTEFEKILDSYDWGFTQIQYNYVNERYQAGRDGLALAEERGLPVIIMEPLLGGKLATGLPRQAEQLLRQVRPDRSCAEWGLRWLWDQPGVTCVLSGMNSLEQLEDNCAAADAALPGCLEAVERDTIARVKALFERSYKVPCTGCNYCMPCPQGISIPSCFAAYNESFSLGRFTGLYHYLTSTGAAGANVRLASDCVGCGACAKRCPQHIDIPAEMKALRKRLEPTPVTAALHLYGRTRAR